MNYRKLKGKLVELGKTYDDCALAIGVHPSTFNNKINGKTKFYIHEINHLAEYLGLSEEEKAVIFMS